MDTLRVEANERVDYGDFNYAVTEALETAIRQQGEIFLANPLGAVRSWILSGFGMTNPPATQQLVVTLGRAILSARIDGQLQHGFIAAEGDLTKIIDMGPLSPANYNVYLRFEIVDGDSSSRIFWDPAGSGSEFASTIATRRKANWSIRVETSNPGPEWVQIGTADNTGAGLVIVDQRKFYFEGSELAAYRSGWSTDGGGGANDRDADRKTYGVQDLQTFTAATRQCLEDIKGRGLRRWWSRDIGGLNVGFDANPVEDRLAVGDAAMYLELSAGHAYYVADTGDFIDYARASNYWGFYVNNVEELRLSASGLNVVNGLYVGNATTAPTDNEIIAEGYIRAGGRLYLGNDDYEVWDGTNWGFVLDGAEEVRIRASGLNVVNGIYVGDLTTVPTNGEIRAVAAIHAGTYLYADNGRLYLGADDYQAWDGTNWQFVLNNAEEMRITANGLAITNGLYVGNFTGVPTDNNIYAEGEIQAAGALRAGGILYLGNDDYISYAGNDMDFYTQGALKVKIGAFGLGVARGLYVGAVGGDAGDNNIYAEGTITCVGGFGSITGTALNVGAGTISGGTISGSSLNVGSGTIQTTGGVLGGYFQPSDALASDPGGLDNSYRYSRRNAIRMVGYVTSAGAVNGWNIASAVWSSVGVCDITPYDGSHGSNTGVIFANSGATGSYSTPDHTCCTQTWGSSPYYPQVKVWDHGDAAYATRTIKVLWLGTL